VLESVNKIIRGYLAGLLIEAAIVAVLNSVALLALGVEYALLLGITRRLAEYDPLYRRNIRGGHTYAGSLVTNSPLSALWVLLLFLVIQFIDNHFLIPYIVASKVRVNALMAIVVVLIGNMLWGVAGMFLAIPITALIKWF